MSVETEIRQMLREFVLDHRTDDDLVSELVRLVYNGARGNRPITALTTTRTRTRYFGGELVDLITEAYRAFEIDFLERSQFVDTETKKDMHDRLEALRLAILRMADHVP